jgi:hypothetical protein
MTCIWLNRQKNSHINAQVESGAPKKQRLIARGGKLLMTSTCYVSFGVIICIGTVFVGIDTNLGKHFAFFPFQGLRDFPPFWEDRSLII